MKDKLLTSFLFAAVFLALGSTALATTTWYVNGVSGSDSNNCLSATSACKTIGHTISLAASGDSIMVAAATYTENLTIGFSLKIVGSGATTTIIDGGGAGTVVTISNSSANVTLSKLTIRNGYDSHNGGGISNSGTLTLVSSTVSGNHASIFCILNCAAGGGGISNIGTMTIINSTLSTNSAVAGCRSKPSCKSGAFGGGIYNSGTLTINNSTLSGNTAGAGTTAIGGGIYNNSGTLTINNSTLSGNRAALAGGMFIHGALTLSNSTLSGNYGGGIFSSSSAVAVALQNSIVATSSNGGNCYGSLTSKGHNLSSDSTCNFSNTGDLNNTDPMLGPLQNNGGPTQTMALPSGSPAVDAGNPNGCTDGLGRPLRTDQRGKPRRDTEDTSGCDMGAYERQSD
jgi:hypothetical protein